MSHINEFTKWSKDRNIQLTNEMGGFSVGEEVIYTNEFGVWFIRNIVGFNLNPSESLPDRVVYLDKDSYWFPVKLSEITNYGEYSENLGIIYDLPSMEVERLLRESEESSTDLFYSLPQKGELFDNNINYKHYH